jgi:drug/metabolite transporter (DMT)-like permease
VILGFFGVMLALNPTGAAFSAASWIAIIGSFSFSLLMISTRLVRGTSDTVLVTTQTAMALLFGLAVAPFTWTPIKWNEIDLWLLIWLGVTAMFAHMCINRSLKIAPASVVVPYQYSTIVWAVILGYIFFGDVPAWSMVAGATIIIGAGIYIFMRERALAKTIVAADPP